MKLILLFINFFLIIFLSSAHAYLDPGSGSILLQALIGIVAALSVSLSLYWQKVKKLFKRIFYKDSKNKEEKS